jgi:anti-anti-sigma factor
MAGQLEFPEEFYIANVAEITEKLVAALRENQDLVLDLTRVERIDSAGIQVLVSARKEAECLGANLSYKLSDAVSSFASRIGITL